MSTTYDAPPTVRTRSRRGPRFHAQGVHRRRLLRVTRDRAIDLLDERIAPTECGEGGRGPAMATEPDDRVVFAVHRGPRGASGPAAAGAHDLSLPAHVGRRVGELGHVLSWTGARARIAAVPQRATQSVPLANTADARPARPGRREPASVGVDARRSATRSSRGRSMSWPIADTTGVVAAATALGGLVAEGQGEVLEAPATARDDDDVDLGEDVELGERRHHLGDRGRSWTATWRISKTTAGHRRRAFSTTSFSAAPALPVTTPIRRGRKGSARLRSRSKRPSAARVRPSWSRRAGVTDTDQADLPGIELQAAAALPEHRFPTWGRPGRRGERRHRVEGGRAHRHREKRSTSVSRRVRYAVPAPGRR